jgi:hypothetical protein
MTIEIEMEIEWVKFLSEVEVVRRLRYFLKNRIVLDKFQLKNKKNSEAELIERQSLIVSLFLQRYAICACVCDLQSFAVFYILLCCD